MSVMQEAGSRTLERSSVLGARWAGVIRAADRGVRVDGLPWRLYDIDLASGVIPTDLPLGPAIYAVIGNGEWQYVGKTMTSVENRMYAHSRDSSPVAFGKRAYWSELVILPLTHLIGGDVLSRVERDARFLLNPRMGQRWG